MVSLLSQTYVQIVLSLLGLMVVSTIAYRWVVSLRDSSKEDYNSASELLKNFEEMRREGDIDEKEFRNIQALLESEAPSKSVSASNLEK